MSREHFLWSERYRPKTINECVLPQRLKDKFNNYIKDGETSHLLLYSSSGTGKTTVAKALADEIDADVLFLNGSDEGRQIDTLRTKIAPFASSFSFENKPKIVIMDEADYTNPESVQPALRAFTEKFSDNCRFIFTCNYRNKLNKNLRSRFTEIDFRTKAKERPELCAQFLKRMKEILDAEGVEYKEKVLAELLMQNFPDFRKTLEVLQEYARTGPIDEGVLGHIAKADTNKLVKCLKEKNFTMMRQWVANNSDTDSQVIFRQIYDALVNIVDTVPQLGLIIADYQFKAAFVADQEINMIACLTEIMKGMKFK